MGIIETLSKYTTKCYVNYDATSAIIEHRNLVTFILFQPAWVLILIYQAFKRLLIQVYTMPHKQTYMDIHEYTHFAL